MTEATSTPFPTIETMTVQDGAPSESSVIALVTGSIVETWLHTNTLSSTHVLDVLPELVRRVSNAFYDEDTAAAPAAALTAQPERNKPTAEQIQASITHDALISFVDGKPYKTLKRHLGTHGLDPASYRRRYGLPRDYPMVAASYSEQRAALAKAIGLGQPRKPLAAA